MKYFAHFFIGKEFSDVVTNTGKLLLKHGNNDVGSSVNLFLVNNENDDKLSIRKLSVSSSATDDLLVGFDKNINVFWGEESSLGVSDQQAFSEFYVKNIFNKILTINNRENFSALYVFLHFPTYKSEALNTVKLFYNAIEESGKPTVIDFMGYGDDIADIIEPGLKITSPSHEQITVFAKFKEEKKMPFNRHFIAIQNASQHGITLSLNLDSLSDIIGRFGMLCTDHYDEIFPSTAEYKDVVSFGLFTLSLDKYLFAEYLFGKTILNAMDRSEVNNSDIDVNIACNEANSLLKNKIPILSEYFKQLPEINGGETFDFSKIQNQFEEEISFIIEECRRILLDNKSITTRTAILAAILAKTECELFSKSIFNQDATSIDDLFSEPINYYIEYNNKIEFYKDEEKPIFNPIKELKEINNKLINSESEIRDLQRQQSSLEKQISDAKNVEECYIEDGFFHFQDNKFRLLPGFKEEPLEETYNAHPVTVKSIDLRQNFNSIKNQGQLGSCLAFSVTSIFEYIIKLNQSKEYDLSEAFLYYNARDLDSNGDISVHTDTGSRYLPAIQSLQKFGIALEKFCPYDDNVYNQKPSEDAFHDAASRKLIKALNVNRSINDIKSALTDGYPVAISLNLCKSFINATNGFIALPTETEIEELLLQDNASKDIHSQHAMVITGFSDEMQMFVVRNSWGTEWGENGYCYVPYLYIDNEQLCNFACIITEIESFSIARMERIPALKVDDTDLTIRYLITKASLDKENTELESNRKKRDSLRLYFEKIKKVISSPNNRDTFIKLSKDKINDEQEELNKIKKIKQDEQDNELENFKQYKKLTFIKTVGFILEFTFLFYLFNSIIEGIICLSSSGCHLEPRWGLILSAIVLIGGILYFRKILPKTALLSVGITFLFFAAHSLITLIRCDSNCDYTVSYLWLILVYTALAGFVYFQSNKRWKVWRDKRDELDAVIRQISKEIVLKDKEKNELKIKTFSAWTLLKSLEKAQTHFQLLYNNYISLINNLRTWYSEIASSNENIQLETITPNSSLLNKDILDKFFNDKISIDSLFEVDLSSGIENHQITEEYLKTYKEAFFDGIVKRLITYPLISDFNISEQVSNSRFSEISLEVTREMINDLNNKSDLFLHISSNERGEIIRSTDIYAPSVNLYMDILRQKLGKYSEPYFESNDKYRLVFLKTATLKYSECVMLKNN